MKVKMDGGWVKILYPEEKWVSVGTLFGWARDAVANGEGEGPVGTLDDAIRILDNAGHVTFSA